MGISGFAVAPAQSSISDQPNRPIAEVKFDFSRHEVVVDALINGQGPYSVLLDTGTAPSVIDLKLAKEIGLKISGVGGEGSGGGSGRSQNFETTLPTIGIGGLVATHVAALATDLSGLSRKFGKPIQAVLGDSLFDGRVVQFDYPGRVARFYASSSGVPSQSSTTTVLRFSHRGNEVRFRGMRINGKPVLANLDTGSSSFFSLTPRGTRLLGLSREAAEAQKSEGAGFNGSYENRVGKLRRVQLGVNQVEFPPVTFWLKGTGHDDRPWDVNVGNQFMKDYVVTIDYRRSIVTFTRSTGP